MTAPAPASIAAAPVIRSPFLIPRYKATATSQTTTHAPSHPAQTADAEIATLLTMPLGDLKERWQKVYSAPAPKNLSRRLLIYALAYELQARAYGGLSRVVKQQLRDIAAPSPSKRQAATTLTKLVPGTRLMREWRGVVHVVDRTDGGFMWNGRTFSSLSAIARAITGVRWNGLAFFGLRKRANTRNAKSLAA